jgi:hypothetical protein
MRPESFEPADILSGARCAEIRLTHLTCTLSSAFSMGKYIVLHDRRLQGAAPIGRRITTLHLDNSTSVFATFPLITTLNQLDGAETLFILCHGYAGFDNRGRVCGDMGGMGLQLGREGLDHSNVARWSAIKGTADNIVVYACGAADTQSDNRGTSADGRYLMGALAIHTQATVYAADRIQWYSAGQDGTRPLQLRALGGYPLEVFSERHERAGHGQSGAD